MRIIAFIAAGAYVVMAVFAWSLARIAADSDRRVARWN